MLTLTDLRKEVKAEASPQRARSLQWFFKTKKGEYGEGDVFIGLMTAQTQTLAKKYYHLSLNDLAKLLKSKIHEERTIALIVLKHKYQQADSKTRKQYFNFYLKNTKGINNWDLVDISAPHILGHHLFDKGKTILYNLAKSKNLWERRMAILATFYFIRENQFSDAIKIAKMLLKDKHDLIHKAVGWMLREVGKRSPQALKAFLDSHHKTMPRTMLRYAIEKLPESKRKKYLNFNQ